MKKITLLTAFVTVCSFVFAQSKFTLPQQTQLTKKVNTIYSANPAPKNNGATQNAMKKAIIWSEDFAGGIPVGWSNTGTPAAALWEYRGPATTPNVGTGGRGDCSSGAPIASTTAANGFMIFDSNYLDNNQYCNATPVNSGAAPAPQIGILQTDSIDLSAESSVMFSFYTDMRKFAGTQSVNVSTDGGVTWTEVWEAGLTPNTPFAGLVSVNITSIAANQADVRLQFEWDADYYEWMIDDIILESAPGNDLILSEKYFNTTDDETNIETHYFQVPFTQANFDTITFGGIVLNGGDALQPNTRLYVDVSGQGTYSDSSAAVNLASNVIDSLNITNSFMPNSGIGTYNITFNVSSDSTDLNPTDNTMNFSFDVTDTVYARDNGDNPMGWQTRAHATDLKAQANLFEIYTQDTATSISVVFGSISNVGTTVSIHLWDSTLTAPIASNSFYQLTNADFGNWVTFMLPKTPLPPGPYFAGVEVVTDTAYIEMDNDPPFPTAPIQTYIYNDATDGTGGGGMWFTERRNIPFIRLNLVKPGDPCVVTPLSATVSTTPADCGADNGTATVTITGGVGCPCAYFWNDPNNQTTATADSLAAGSYSVIVTDDNNCQQTISNITISNIGGATVSDTIITQPLCNGDNNGEIILTVVSDTGIVLYSWNCSGSNGPQASGLSAGSCTVTITDSAGCITNETYMVNEPAALTATTSFASDTLGMSVGTATVTPIGGTPGYFYMWDANTGNQTTQTATGLSAGVYTVFVTDANGCTGSSPFSVTVDSVGVVGLMELNDEVSFNIYPNPTNGQFIVEFSNQKKDETLIEVKNIIGQLIYSEEIDNIAGEFTKQIDLSEHRGVYFLSISNSSGTRTEKLIVY